MAFYKDWVHQLEKDLKGRPWTDLQWNLGEDIVMDPFYHPDVYFPQRQPLGRLEQGNNWSIGELIDVFELKAANSHMLDALQGGAEALELSISQSLSVTDWAKLLENVQLEYISLHLVLELPAAEQEASLQAFCTYCQQEGINVQLLQGSISGINNSSLDAMGIAWAAQHLPSFKPIVLDGTPDHQGSEHSVHELIAILKKGEALLSKLQEQGMNIQPLASKMLFKVALSKSYFVEIAKQRALRILWSNVLKAYGLTSLLVDIAVYFAPESQDANTNSNLIRAATQALSAVIGGTQYLYVLPANVGAGESPTPFSLRMARNVQHLLRLESHLDKVQDPAAGSFYIEKLTEELAQKAWALFQKEGE